MTALARAGKRSPRAAHDTNHAALGLVDAISIRVPASASTLEGFVAWAISDHFPPRGQFSFIEQEIFIDMSPEEIATHAKVKAEISRTINNLNEEDDLGEFFPDRTLISNEEADLATEPDATLVRWRSYQSGRVRLIPRRDTSGQYVEVRGSPDWVLEVVSRSSIEKDTVLLRAAYHRAGVPEYWLINAMDEDIVFQILVRRRDDYAPVRGRHGWYRSPVFGRAFRLERRRNRMGRWRYQLQVKPA